MPVTPDVVIAPADLAGLGAGTTARVKAISGGRSAAARLEALGLRVGVQVEKVSDQPLGGPVVVRVGSTCIALGAGMARRILVEPVDARP